MQIGFVLLKTTSKFSYGWKLYLKIKAELKDCFFFSLVILIKYSVAFPLTPNIIQLLSVKFNIQHIHTHTHTSFRAGTEQTLDFFKKQIDFTIYFVSLIFNTATESTKTTLPVLNHEMTVETSLLEGSRLRRP